MTKTQKRPKKKRTAKAKKRTKAAMTEPHGPWLGWALQHPNGTLMCAGGTAPVVTDEAVARGIRDVRRATGKDDEPLMLVRVRVKLFP